ncbi:MAG: hypothetical protein IIC60_05710 [Proteobacteria bacterium]|nr:hypothetical protein [Pseudomonadota bacterium]
MSTLRRRFTALAVLVFSTAVAAQSLTAYPDGPRPLSVKWEWALEQAADPQLNTAWIASQFSTELDEKLQIAITSRHDDYYQG